jgi:hypothetical protein
MAQELADKIRAAAQAKNIDPDIALAIARAESSLRPSAQAGTSSAGGLFQVVDKTWKEFGGNPKKKLDADENIRVGTDIIAKNTQTLKSFLNRDPRPAEVYAAHYFGPSGAKNFLSADPATPIVDILGKAAVKANPNLQGKNVGQVMAQLEKKMGSGPAPTASVSRETPAPARQPLPPSLPPMAATEESSAPPSRMASLGPSYQAALALSFLADTDEKEDRDVDREPGVAEKWLAEQAPRPAALAQFADLSIKSPFAAMEPQQPQMLADGGEVESTASKVLKAVVPMDLRILGSTLMGNRDPITESNFRPEELAAMQQAVDRAAARTGKTQKGSVQYVDYPRGEEIGRDFQPVGQTLGRFVYEKSPTGQTIITDKYDFYNEGRKANVEKYEKMGRAEKALSVSGNMLKNLVTGNLRQVPAELAEAYIGRDGREVRIQLPVKRADGGDAAPTAEEIATASRPATVNPNIRRQGEAARRLAAMRDVNTLPDPRTYAAVSGFLGQAPDELGFSVMHPDAEGIKKAGQAGFGVGTALQIAPAMGALRAAGVGPSSAGRPASAASQLGAVKMRGGTFGYTGQSPGVSKLDYLLDEYAQEAKSARAPQALQEFLKAKAPKYFSTSYGTADDPLRTAIRERRIEPFGRDQSKLPPYLVDAAKFPQARGHLQAKLDLERMYDEMTGVRAYAYKPEGSAITERGIRQDISEKMGQEGVPIEARNPPSVDTYSAEEFVSYPTSSRMLRQLVENQETLPPNLQQALRTGEPIFDVDTNMFLLRPSNVIEALQQVPANKLKNMSFPEALIQGTQALAPVRDYRTAIDMADRGAKLPPAVLQQFTSTVAPAPGGQWVQLTKPVATELEGKLMKHSVGGYGSGDTYGTGYTGLPYGGKKAFDEGLVRVYSLRNKAGEPTITVEMAKPRDADAWNVTQVRGRFNSEPKDRESVFNLFDKIDDAEGLGQIKPNSYSRSATGEDLESGSSVDWGNEYSLWKQSAE